jgi:hypothetical protein
VHRNAAEAGNADSKAFMDRAVPEGGWETMSIEELGTRIGQITQGRYDSSEVPPWAMEGALAPYARLARWSIGQGNNLIKYGVDPVLKNPRDLQALTRLVSMGVGGLISGAGYVAYKEWLTGKKSPAGTEKEIESAKFNKDSERAYKAALLADAAGTMGMYGSLLLQGMNALQGRKASAFTFPLIDNLRNIASETASFAKAMNEGADILDAGPVYLEQLGKNVIGSWMQVYQRLSSEVDPKGRQADDLKIANQNRDVTVYNRLQKDELPSGNIPSTDYSTVTERKFKRSTVPTLQGAEDVLEQVIRKSKGDSGEVVKRLESASNMSIHSIPGIGDMKTVGEAVDYLSWVEKNQGREAAKQLVQDYAKRKDANDVKKELLKAALARKLQQGWRPQK